MKRVKLPLGKSSFEAVRKQELFYIDKTSLIAELEKNEGTEVFLFTRPRRFGKTLTMSMLSSFFDISKDSTGFFEGLKISENRELCDKWMNRFPTVFLSFKPFDGLDFESAFDSLKDIIFNLFCDFSFLMSSDKVDFVLKEKYNVIYSGNPTVSDIKGSLSLLVRMLSAHYGGKVVLLIDEYDVPMAKSSSRGYYDAIIDVMRSMLQVLKDNDYIQFAVMTGCMRIAKESIFTGLNNVYSNTVTSRAYGEYFGFTEDEVNETFKQLEVEDRLDEVKVWYDGYHFGDEDIYCPWDVIHYLYDLSNDPKAKPRNYWANTSSNDIIESFISRGRKTMFDDLDTLLEGGSIMKVIDENITYDYLHSSDNNIWSILLMTGYLTPVRRDDEDDSLRDDEVELKIPNREIMNIFSSSLTKWINAVSGKGDLVSLADALWTGRADVISSEMTRILNDTISYNDLWHEAAYHLFFDGIFRGMGYRVDSNKEHGMGRPDIVVFDKKRKRAALFEFKGINETLESASRQIDDKKYADGLTDCSLILCYAVRFSDKTAEVFFKEKIER